MCGIFGSVGSPLDPELVPRVFATFAHRGPEGRGVQRFDRALLMHTRLRINDLSPAAAQPMCNEDRLVWVTFNGEIYNFHALRHELEILGHRFRSHADTEVIVHGYEAWGDDVVDKLEGMFAFGLWDCRSDRLLLARDRVGKKPLFYAHHDGRLSFASEIKSLFAAGVKVAPRPAGVAGFLAHGYTPAPATIYENVFELPPAHTLSLRASETPQVRRYWQVDFAAAQPAPTAAEAEARVLALFEASVKRRLVADVPVGAFLSGGFDSTAVVAMMSQAGRQVRTFAVGSDDPAYNEAPFARLAADALGTTHTEVNVTPADVQRLGALTWHYDGPVGDSSAIPTYKVSQLARQSVTVVLTGDGGDELFAGYLRFGAACAAERVPHVLRPLLRWAGARLPGSASGRRLSARAQRFLKAAALPLADRMAFWTSPFQGDVAQLLQLHMLSHAEALASAHRLRFATQTKARSTLAQVLEDNFNTYLPSDLLVKVDRCSMAHALEARSPFLDHALVSYAAALPDAFKRRGLTSKYILRKALNHLIPPAIAARPKMGFGIPLATWFRNDLRSYLGDHLAAPHARLFEYVQKPFVERLLREHMDAAADHALALFALLALEVWLQTLRAPDWFMPAP